MDEILWTDYDGLIDEDIDEELRGLSIEAIIDMIANLEEGEMLSIEAAHG